MTSYFYFLSTVFAIVFALILIDNNVGSYIDLKLRLLGINIQRLFWIIRFHPNNFITTFLQNRKYSRIAREIQMERESQLSNNNRETIE